jgi:hypothetical protein
MLKQAQFSILKDGPDLKKYVKKFVHNISRATKPVVGGHDTTISPGKED